MTKFILTVTIAAAALAAGLCFDMPAAASEMGFGGRFAQQQS